MAGPGEGQRRGRPFHHPARGPPGPPPPPLPKPVDREKTCPLLLRVFTKNGSHHVDADFAVRGKEPKDEVQIYTWMDATLRELTDLVKEVAPEARRANAVLSFAFVFPAKSGRYVVRESIKSVISRGGRILVDSLMSQPDRTKQPESLVLIDKVGKTFSYPNGRRPDDGNMALGNLKFEIGDYLDVAIL